jgi:hypothetical protein
MHFIINVAKELLNVISWADENYPTLYEEQLRSLNKQTQKSNNNNNALFVQNAPITSNPNAISSIGMLYHIIKTISSLSNIIIL